MGDTNIEWTDATWNPVRGCTKISPGCKHCYAETFAERFRGVKGHPYERGFDLRLAPDKLDAPLDWKKPRRVFVNSMSDLFHEDVPEDYLGDVFRVMAVCPQHTFQILTKRAERMADVLKRMHLVDGRPRIASQKYRGDSRFEGPPLPNVWLGVSVEDQAYADWRIPHLLKTPAAVRFLSCEPLLGPVDLSDLLGLEGGHGPPGTLAPVHRPGIDWVIVGGARERRDIGPLSRAIIEAIPQLWYRLIGGQFWVGGWRWWGSPSFVSFFREVCDLDLGREMTERAQAYQDTASSACWWWPHKEWVIACDRPMAINRDDRGRLHSLTGPSIAFRDGWSLYHVHGVRVPGEIIVHPESITPARIEKEPNTEVRRVMIERYGVSRFLLDSGAKEIHRDERGILYRKELAGDEPLVMVKVKNSTAEPDGSVKDYFLRVPPAMQTAAEAVAWTFGKERASDYTPELET